MFSYTTIEYLENGILVKKENIPTIQAMDFSHKLEKRGYKQIANHSLLVENTYKYKPASL